VASINLQRAKIVPGYCVSPIRPTKQPIKRIFQRIWKTCQNFPIGKEGTARTVSSGGASGARPHLKFGPPISHLAPWQLHTSNTTFSKCGPPFWFLVPLAAKSWQRAWVQQNVEKFWTIAYSYIKPCFVYKAKAWL